MVLPIIDGTYIAVYSLPQPLIFDLIGKFENPFCPAADLLGSQVAGRVARLSVELYTRAAQYAISRGLILADTKFEFGFVPLVLSPPSSPTSPASPISADSFDDPFRDKELILVDEALTPDSSRYWPKEGFTVGQVQPSFDKQYLRDWLTDQGFQKGMEEGPDGDGWTISPEVVEGTASRYREAETILVR